MNMYIGHLIVVSNIEIILVLSKLRFSLIHFIPWLNSSVSPKRKTHKKKIEEVGNRERLHERGEVAKWLTHVYV